MPFFRHVEHPRKITLQVRKPKDRNNQNRMYGEKRVWAFSSRKKPVIAEKEERKKEGEKGCKASVSVEAAMALSLFIFAMVCMMVPFRMMERQRQIQASLESVNEQLCQYAYLEYQMNKGEELPKDEGDWKQEIVSGLIRHGAKAGAQMMVEGMFPKEGVEDRSFSGFSYLEDGETIVCSMDYRMRMPFSVLHLDSLPFSGSSTRRAWIGRDGLSADGDGNEDEEDPIVYIGKTSTRYHKSRNCHYLSNQLQTVDYEIISRLRNENGGKYYPCAVCGSGAHSGSRVYIMKSGSRYHRERECSAIIAYVQAVRLSEVEYMGGCSYCSR